MKKWLLITVLYLIFNSIGYSAIQYAASVFDFSSQYGPVAWSAEKALGAPDVYPNYGDYSNAWASQTAGGQREFLVLGYTTPMQVSHIGIYETFNTGAVDTIYVRNASNGQWVIVWSGSAGAQPPASRIFEVSFELTSFNVDAVRIAINSPVVNGWNEIDAVAIADETITGGGGGGGGGGGSIVPGEIALLAHYPLTGHVNDVSGNDFHGTIVGSVVASEGPDGQADGAMYFDGQQSYIQIENNELLDNPGNAMTITYWVNIEMFYFGLWASVVCKSDAAEAHYRLGHGSNSSYFAFNGRVAYNTVNYPIGVDDGWTFVAASYDGDSVRFYKNETLLHTMPLMLNSSFSNQNNKLYIGYDPALGDDWLNGHVHDVRIYSGALTSEQVMAVKEGEEPASNRKIESPQEIALYPNPVRDYFSLGNVNKLIGNKIHVIVYDMSGRVVLNENYNNDQHVDVRNLQNGVYLVKVFSGDKLYHGRLIKH